MLHADSQPAAKRANLKSAAQIQAPDTTFGLTGLNVQRVCLIITVISHPVLLVHLTDNLQPLLSVRQRTLLSASQRVDLRFPLLSVSQRMVL
jgi:hypothetical protein